MLNVMKVLCILPAAALGLLTASCSLVLDWGANEKPCLNNECFDQYSCLADVCVEDGSVEELGTCTQTRQCNKDDGATTCAPAGAPEGVAFTCRKKCNAYFTTPASCGSGNYCRPVLNQSGSTCTSSCKEGECVEVPGGGGERRCQFFEGVCMPSDDCVPGESTGCGAGEVCVKISSSANACLTRCEIKWGSTYSDNCGSTTQAPKYCQPVGEDIPQQLVCLDSRIVPQSPGNACDPVDNPCARGSACIDGICYLHCDSTPSADLGDIRCQEINPNTGEPYSGACCTQGHGSYGVCRPGCE